MYHRFLDFRIRCTPSEYTTNTQFSKPTYWNRQTHMVFDSPISLKPIVGVQESRCFSPITGMITLLPGFFATQTHTLLCCFTYDMRFSISLVWCFTCFRCSFGIHTHTSFSENDHITLYLNMIRVDYRVWCVLSRMLLCARPDTIYCCIPFSILSQRTISLQHHICSLFFSGKKK